MTQIGRVGLLGGLLATLTLAACGGGNGAPAGGGMMAGRGGMMGGMMSSAPRDTAAAPLANVAAATAPGCPATSQALVDRGREVFTGAGNCYACHSSNAKGTAAAPDLTDSTWLNIDGSYGAIAQLVRTGVSHPKKFPGVMPAKGGAALDSLQVCAVAAYVYSVGH